MGHIFISYARSSEAQARRVEQALIAAGFGVWRDNALPVHQAYADVIEQQLADADAVLTLWSADARSSDWVRAEANRARELGKLVQASLDRTLPPMPFNQLHCADLSRWGAGDATGWTKVIESLTVLRGAPPARLLASNHTLPQAAPDAPLVAVLAFDNLSGDPAFLYFSDGLSDEILHAVSSTTSLRLIGRSSSFELRGPAKAAANVAARLGASHMLDGSVRRSGDRVRISAELVDCASQSTLWTQRFDRDLSDIFALQDEIAGAVAAALKTAFAPRNAGAVDPVVYDLYLRAKEFVPTRLGWDEQLLEEVLRLAPDFVPALEGLVLTHATLIRYDDDTSRIPVRMAHLNAAADRLISLAPDSAVPPLSRVMLTPLCGGYVEAEHAIARALEIAPHQAFLHASARAAEVGRSRVALAYAERAVEADPLDMVAITWRAALLATNGRSDESKAAFDDAVPRWPHQGFVRTTAIGKAIEMEDWARFEQYVTAPGELGIYGPWVELLAHAGREIRVWTPKHSVAHLAQQEAIRTATGTVGLSGLGLHCRYGFADEVYALLDRASFAHLFRPEGRLLPGDVTLSLLFGLSARWLRQDIRFVRFCARLGLCDYWLETDRWPDCTDEVADLYDFRTEAKVQANSTPRG